MRRFSTNFNPCSSAADLDRPGLLCQDPGKDQHPARRNQVCQAHAEQADDDRREDIRQHQRRLPELEPALPDLRHRTQADGKTLRRDPVGVRVFAAGLDRGLVDIHSQGQCCAEFQRADRQDPGTTADIDHG